MLLPDRRFVQLWAAGEGKAGVEGEGLEGRRLLTGGVDAAEVRVRGLAVPVPAYMARVGVEGRMVGGEAGGHRHSYGDVESFQKRQYELGWSTHALRWRTDVGSYNVQLTCPHSQVAVALLTHGDISPLRRSENS